MEHSVLGPRWVYDACTDPVYASALARVLLAGGMQAEEWVEDDDGPVRRTPSVVVTGGGSPDAQVAVVDEVADLIVSTVGTISTIIAASWELTVARLVDSSGGQPVVDGELIGSWSAQTRPVLLASARRL